VGSNTVSWKIKSIYNWFEKLYMGIKGYIPTTFNILATIAIFCGFKKRVKAQPIDIICNEERAKDNSTDYMEVLIVPEEYRYPYSDKTNEVLMNHIRAGKSKREIKNFIISRCKVIKVPIQ